MKVGPRFKVYLLAVGVVASATTLWSLLEATYYFRGWFDFSPLPEAHTWVWELSASVSIWCPWILLTPALLFFCRRIRIVKGHRVKGFFQHALASLGVGLVKALLESFLLIWLLNVPLAVLQPKVLLSILAFESVFYWIFFAAYSGISYYRRFKEREIESSRLEASLAQAKLEALKMPLRPHFLFNTLHSISTLVHCDVKAADRMICRLSDLLRLSMEHIDYQEIPLRREIDFLKLYIEILQIRFGNELVVEMDIADETKDAYVPSFLIQPIVENAVIHGIDPKRSRALIAVSSYRKNGRLCIEVSDNGPGLTRGDPMDRGGIGLKNTLARLQQLYGDQGEIAFPSSEGRGLRVCLSLPFHTAPIKAERIAEGGHDSDDHRG